MSRTPLLCLVVAFVTLLPQLAVAQPPADTLNGTVTERRSGRPLPAATITVAGTGARTVTDPRGRFLLVSPGGGARQLTVSAIGFRPVTVTTTAGQRSVAIALEEVTIELEELIVTGTAGAVEKRALGNSVAQINTAELAEIAPAADVNRLINGRAAGVVFQAGSGGAGNGGKIRIRGNSSLSLANEPLLYVDGVRVDNNLASGPQTFRTYTSRLNDFNPEEIESIEIIKGPAAATLYGTEASNGVIQIITKKGVRGRPKVNVTMGQGANWLSNPEGRFPTAVQRLADGTIRSVNLVETENLRGTPIFSTGQRGQYGVDVTGGTDAISYFVSGGYETEEGVVLSNRLRRFNGRANLTVAITDRLDVATNFGYVAGKTFINRDAQGPLAGAFVPRLNLIDTPNRGFLGGPPEAFYEAYTDFSDVDRVTGGFQMNHRPTSWFTHRLNVGTDIVNEDNQSFVPRLRPEIAGFFGGTALGFKQVDRRNVRNYTADYGATATVGLTEQLGSRSSIGGQFYRRQTRLVRARGDQFPAPGVTAVSSAAVITGGEDLIENTTLGVYAEQQFSWKDRLYLTGALRADDNSAFGKEFDLVIYPKVSGSWVLSDEPFWPKSAINTMRLRGAYGQSGQQPDAFASLLTYEAITGPGNQSTVRPQFLGNPSLGPEKGSEVELGFEAAVWDDRIGIDFTWYDKRTKDAILARVPAPSLGFPGAQFVNIGEVKNTGFEVMVSGKPIQRDWLYWDLRFSVSRNDNEIVDMGGVAPIAFAVRQIHREGFPVGALFDQIVVSADLGANGRPTNLMCDGGVNDRPGGSPVPCAGAPRLYLGTVTPKWEGSIASTMTFGSRLSLYGLVDFKTGHKIFDANRAILCLVNRACPENVDPSVDIVRAAGFENAILSSSIYGSGFAKLRQLSLSYLVPSRLAAWVGASAASITLTGRNLATWSNWPGVDPELLEITRGNEHYNQQQLQMPLPTQFVATIKLTF
jgi:TonB-linked SusC/RagA family outer membrane protein